MSAEIRHFGKPLFVIQMETKEVWGWDRTGKSIVENEGGGMLLSSKYFEVWVRDVNTF